MNIPIFISRRYLFSKKSTNVINVITLVSIIGIAVGTAAMILVLSIFNGLTGLIEDLFSAMDADLRIEATIGKQFIDTDSLFQVIQKTDNVRYVSRTIEGKAGLKYQDRQAQATIKGVDSLFPKINPICGVKKVNKTDSIKYIYDGIYDLSYKEGIATAIMGGGVADVLKANINDVINPIHVYVKTQGPITTGNPLPAFKSDLIFPVAYFAIQKEYDDSYILISFEAAQSLFDMQDKISAYELGLKNPKDADKTQKVLQEKLGKNFKILTLPDRHKTLYKVMRNEKYVSYLIMILLVAITVVNIVGSLSMIVLEKTKDIAVLKAMGTSDTQIRKIFLMEGLWVGGIGVGLGMLIGTGIAVLQMEYGFLKITETSSYQLDTFPIALNLTDFILVAITVIGLSMLAALYPSKKAANVEVVEGLRK